MNPLLPLPVVIPLLMTAAIAGFSPLLRRRRRVLDAIAILTSGAVAVLLAVILTQSAHGDIVYWFAGFRPHHDVVLGIDFEAEPLSTGLACLTAVLVTASMVFSWRYFEQAGVYYHALMLTFLAGMAGFCLTGDIFDLFVWFELMSVAAYALTAYRPDERGPLQGALNFAITNSVGAFLSLSGIALIYGRTGALNMAQIGHDLAGHRPDGLVLMAFVLIITGLLVKAGDRALPVLARRRARGGAHPGVRALLRGHGGARTVRSDAGVLVDVRGGPRAPARDHRGTGHPRPAHGRDRRAVLLPRNGTSSGCWRSRPSATPGCSCAASAC